MIMWWTVLTKASCCAAVTPGTVARVSPVGGAERSLATAGSASEAAVA